jgi:DNA mismatch repair protein MutS
MRQYLELKAQHPAEVLLFRMGDFYELFFEDAVECAPILGVALTSRDGEIPMCGIPYHALDPYLTRLLAAGKRVAIGEQVEDPKQAVKLVKREVVRVITPGLSVEGEEDALIAAYAEEGNERALAVLGLASGRLEGAVVGGREDLEDALATAPIRELLIHGDRQEAFAGLPVVLTPLPDDYFSPLRGGEALREYFRVASLKGFGLESDGLLSGVLGALLRYARETLKGALPAIPTLTLRHVAREVVNATTLRNLEVFSTMDGRREGSFFAFFDRSATAMGRRVLREFLQHPLTAVGPIRRRQAAVAWLASRPDRRRELQEILRAFPDVPRVLGRLAMDREHPREVLGMGQALARVPALAALLDGPLPEALEELRNGLAAVPEEAELILRTLQEEIPLQIKEGGFIRRGVNPRLDELDRLRQGGHDAILAMEEAERRRTGIATLRIKYNKVFGYFLEVGRGHAGKVPPEYIRKQTVVNAERYVTPEIKELEERILQATEKAAELELKLYADLKGRLRERLAALQSLADRVGLLDALASMARVAHEENFCLPEVEDEARLRIEDGWHPVVAKLVKLPFVPNDADLSGDGRQIVLLTGPNMGGKSTYLRQVGLIVLLAQAGSFVSARSARVGIVDHLFTRVGSADFLFRGESTFMVEMLEMARILRHATARSLVLLDEVGRGTATFDGLSIAWSVVEHLHEREDRRAMTLFATHYHELTELALLFPRVVNMTMAVKEYGDRILFLHRVIPGTASKSYGIEVARLAGVPAEVVARARRILENLESAEIDPTGKPRAVHEEPMKRAQLPLFGSAEHPMAEELRGMDPDAMTPVEALNWIARWKKELK